MYNKVDKKKRFKQQQHESNLQKLVNVHMLL